MPPKKGGGSNGIWGFIMLPISAAYNLVFFPAHWAMWILVDKLGDDKGGGWTYLAKPLMKDERFRKCMQYVKEFRYVLCDYFQWTRIASPAWRCKKCSKPGTIWCVDCGMKYCKDCAKTTHRKGVTIESHSLEEIRFSNKHRGIHFLSPMLPEVLIGLLVLRGFFHDFLTPEYLTTQVSCPMVHRVQGFVASWDTSLLFHMKSSFFQWCNMEDSYFRFILDAWVRSIVTLSDNSALVFQALPHALLFDVVLMYCLVPVVACLYALIEYVVYKIEKRVPREGVIGEHLLWLEEVAPLISKAHVFALGPVIPIPLTYHRTREPMDFADDLCYRLDRKVRHFKFVYRNALVGLQNLAWHLIVWTMAFRLACIWFGLGRPLRFILSWVGFGSTIATHQQDYKAVHSMLLSENIVWGLLMRSLKSVNVFLGFMPSALFSAALLWLFLSIVAIACSIKFCHRVVMERRNFIAGKKAAEGLAALLEKIEQNEKQA